MHFIMHWWSLQLKYWTLSLLTRWANPDSIHLVQKNGGDLELRVDGKIKWTEKLVSVSKLWRVRNYLKFSKCKGKWAENTMSYLKQFNTWHAKWKGRNIRKTEMIKMKILWHYILRPWLISQHEQLLVIDIINWYRLAWDIL